MFRPRPGPFAPAFAWALLATAAIALVWQLMTPPVVGLANNGDFGKLLGRFGMGSGAGFEFANTTYVVQDQYRYHSGFNSSELLLILPALAISRVISKDGSFDLRIMGAVHAFLFLLAMFLLVRSINSWWVGPMAMLLLCDFMYAGYFNSFYMDTAAYLFTLMTIVFYVRAVRRPGAVETAGLLIAMLLAITSKPQYSLMGLWFALLFWMGRRILCRGSKPKTAAAVAILLLTTWVSFRFLAPESYRAKAAFNVIFSQVAPHASNPAQALRELGLDHSYDRWIGQSAYLPGSVLEEPAFYRPLLERTSFRRIAAYYCRHPAEAWIALRSSLDEAGRFEPPGGHFDSSLGRPPGTQYASFHLASNVKRRLFHHHGSRLFFSFVGAALLTIVMLLWNRARLPAGTVSGGIVLAGMAAATLVTSGLADAYESARHQLVWFALLDLLLLGLAWLIVEFRPLRVPGWLILLTAACVVAVGSYLYRPLPPLPGEFDDYYPQIARFAIWNAILFVLIGTFLCPRRSPRIGSHFFAAAAVCVLFTGWMLYRITPVGAGRCDDFDHRVRFASEWSRDTQFADASNHSLTYSDIPNAAFRVAFHGAEISWVHTMAANRGIAAIYVDGRPRGEVDLYSPATEWQRRTVFPESGRGDHIFEVRILNRKNPRSSGTFVDVDALIVR